MWLVQSHVTENRRWNWIFWVSEQFLHCSQCLQTCLRLFFSQSLQRILVHSALKVTQRGDLDYVTWRSAFSIKKIKIYVFFILNPCNVKIMEHQRNVLVKFTWIVCIWLWFIETASSHRCVFLFSMLSWDIVKSYYCETANRRRFLIPVSHTALEHFLCYITT